MHMCLGLCVCVCVCVVGCGAVRCGAVRVEWNVYVYGCCVMLGCICFFGVGCDIPICGTGYWCLSNVATDCWYVMCVWVVGAMCVCVCVSVSQNRRLIRHPSRHLSQHHRRHLSLLQVGNGMECAFWRVVCSAYWYMCVCGCVCVLLVPTPAPTFPECPLTLSATVDFVMCVDTSRDISSAECARQQQMIANMARATREMSIAAVLSPQFGYVSYDNNADVGRQLSDSQDEDDFVNFILNQDCYFGNNQANLASCISEACDILDDGSSEYKFIMTFNHRSQTNGNALNAVTQCESQFGS